MNNASQPPELQEGVANPGWLRPPFVFLMTVGFACTVTIVRSGPFRYSRNPIYLAFGLLHLGLALAYGSAWLLVTLVPAVLLINLVVIRRKKRYLEGRFGASYKASVRRWI
jgi:protein-S-isoprenylcysteine O-methyltransferase Ste14